MFLEITTLVFCVGTFILSLATAAIVLSVYRNMTASFSEWIDILDDIEQFSKNPDFKCLKVQVIDRKTGNVVVSLNDAMKSTNQNWIQLIKTGNSRLQLVNDGGCAKASDFALASDIIDKINRKLERLTSLYRAGTMSEKQSSRLPMGN